MGTVAMVRRVDKCRGCGGGIFMDVINLGRQYVVDFPKERDDDALAAPLVVVRCLDCNLVQLAHSVAPDRLYKKFWYRSGISEQMRQALDEIVRRVNSAVHLDSGDRVLDIGANDGTLLEMYPQHVTTVGIDPASELIIGAGEKGKVDVAIADYFSAEKVENYGPYKVITAIAMFYDLEDPKKFLQDCRAVLHQNGLLIIQMNYLVSMLQNVAVDNISHEHLEYFSATTLNQLVNGVGLEIVGAETNDVNGGSFRVYITKPGSTAMSGMTPDRQAELYARFLKLLADEEQMGLHAEDPYMAFEAKINKMKYTLRYYLESVKHSGGRLFLYGASTRGATLLQLLQLPEGMFEAAAERDEKKWGRLTGGTWVPIVDEVTARKQATHFLVLPYHFWETIKRREYLWMENGGTFILPLPEPTLITSKGEHRLTLPGLLEKAPVTQ